MAVRVGNVTINVAVLVGPTPTPPKSRSDPLHCPQAPPAAVWRQSAALLFLGLSA